MEQHPQILLQLQHLCLWPRCHIQEDDNILTELLGTTRTTEMAEQHKPVTSFSGTDFIIEQMKKKIPFPPKLSALPWSRGCQQNIHAKAAVSPWAMGGRLPPDVYGKQHTVPSYGCTTLCSSVLCWRWFSPVPLKTAFKTTAVPQPACPRDPSKPRPPRCCSFFSTLVPFCAPCSPQSPRSYIRPANTSSPSSTWA